MARRDTAAARGRRNAAGNARIAKLHLAAAQEAMDRYLTRVVSCLGQLSQKEIWWRPNSASNSAGNLTLHLCGNIRQWIISGLGGAADVRVRETEFAERGPLPRRAIIRRLEQTVREALRVMRRLSPSTLAAVHTIQGFRVTGLNAVFNVTEHFSHHAGQILYITKMKRACDLKFTQLPGTPKRRDHP